jgi:hypothetical protein
MLGTAPRLEHGGRFQGVYDNDVSQRRIAATICLLRKIELNQQYDVTVHHLASGKTRFWRIAYQNFVEIKCVSDGE